MHLTENLGIKRCRGNTKFQLRAAYFESIMGIQLSHWVMSAIFTSLIAFWNFYVVIAQVQVASIPARVWSASQVLSHASPCERCVCWTWGTNGYRLGKHEAGEIANIFFSFSSVCVLVICKNEMALGLFLLQRAKWLKPDRERRAMTWHRICFLLL